MPLIYNKDEQRYVPQLGAVTDQAANFASGVARTQLQAMCPGTDISKVTDAEVMAIASDIVKNISALDLIQLADNKSNVFKTFADKLGVKVCELGKSKAPGSGWTMPTWGYAAIVGGVLLFGWIVFRKK